MATPYSAGRFEFGLDGVGAPTTYVKSVEGGAIKRHFVSESIGTDNEQIKHDTTQENDAITVEIGMSSARDMIRWARSSWEKKGTRRNGVIVSGDFEGKGRSGIGFLDALLLELTFPTMDASSKDPSYLKAKFLPELVQPLQANGVPLGGVTNPGQKAWTTAAFGFRFDHLPLIKVNKIESFTVKHSYTAFPSGRSLLPELVPHKVEFPNIVLHISANQCAPLRAWHEMARRGLDLGRHTGAIDFLNPQRALPMFSIELDGIDIVSISNARSEAASDTIQRCRVELSVASMKMSQVSTMT